MVKLAAYLICGLADSERAADVGRAATIDYTIIHDQIPDSADCVMKGTFRFVNNLEPRR